MIHIDPRTVILMSGIMSGVMSLVLYSVKRSYPASIRGPGEWSTALLLVFIGGLLGGTRGLLPDQFPIAVGRLFLGTGLYVAYLGTQRFFNVTPHFKPWFFAIGCAMLLQVWFTVVNPNYHVRLAAANTLAFVLFTLQARLLFQQGIRTFARGLTLGVLVIMAAIQAMRFVTSFIWPVGNDLFDTSIQHTIYLSSFAFCILIYSVGVMLMASDRLRGELEHLATHDSLTNALTRRCINDLIETELERCRRHGRSMALLMIDLDHFKTINDTYGHQAGDQVLIAFAARVNALLRGADQLGRFGGEEFIVLLPDTSPDEARQVAERIRVDCAQAGAGPSYTVSIGVSTNQDKADTLETLLGRADAAVYQAKALGRNRIEAG